MRRALLASFALAQLLLPRPAMAQEGFEPVVDGLDFAANVAFAPDGTIFVADKDVGEIRIVRDGEILDEPFATVETFSPVNEMGLLGVAVHPDFPSEPWVYAYYSDANESRNRLVRFRADGDVAVERQDLLDLLPTTFGIHNGGDLAFGPDGMLYVTVGEGSNQDLAQEALGIGGRILRLKPDGSVPPNNPLGPDNPTFALGIRNSFGVCIDPDSGDVWATDNGPSTDDELNLVPPGANLGWPAQLGPGGEPRFRDPVLSFTPTIVITGCAVSDDDLYFGEGYAGNLHRMPLPGPDERIVGRFEGGITDVAVAPDGALWVVTPNVLYRRAPAQTTSPTSPSPTSPSETATASESPTPSPSASPSPAGEGGGLTTTAGIVVAGLLIGGLLLMRSRLLRR
jgi:glucose/arabinose dehydrogenase